jgi:hypothetical protein
MNSAKYTLTIGLLVVVGGTAALAGRTPAPSSHVPAVAPVVVEVEAAGILLPEYGVYIPLPDEIASAAQL